MIIGALIPFILLGLIVLYSEHMLDRLRNALAFFAASLLMIQVFAMRWNVVIGGQMLSKSLRGFRDFEPEFFGREGVAVAILLFTAPLVLLYFLMRILPLLDGSESAAPTDASAEESQIKPDLAGS